MKTDLTSMESNAVTLYRNKLHGILSTISKVHNDYPFGSFVTFISGQDRSIIIYASDIAPVSYTHLTLPTKA